MIIIQIKLEEKNFVLVTGLKFGVEYSDDYDDKDKPIPFRRRVFPSCLDGKRITGKDVEDLIESKSFKKLDDDDAVSLCCIGILQLVLLGYEDIHMAIGGVPIRAEGILYTTHAVIQDIAWTYNKKFYRPCFVIFLHEQRSGLDQMMKQGQNIFEKMKKYMEELNVGIGANREPIIADQHYGISDLSGFQSIQ
ncbi:hypothetical protein Tco_1140777, partial [Tanacetum coccineum]